jgi:hypothetical protein
VTKSCSTLKDDGRRLYAIAALLQETVDGFKGTNGDINGYVTHIQMLLP